MVRYAQNCPLPCNPTVQQSLRYQKQYKSAQKLMMLSEDKLKMRMKSFLDNHLVDVIQTFSLVSKGSQSKISKLENQRKKSLYDERKNNLENICSYFQENSDLLKDLELELKKNFQHKIQEIFEKIKVSLQSTIDTYETLVTNKIHSIQSQIKQSLSNIQREMDKLKIDQRLKVSQTINGRLTYDQISKLLNIPQEDLRGYITILKMIEKGSPLMRKIAILEEDFTENDQFSCEREIDQLNINCSSINCGEMWNVIQLFKKKRDFSTSFSFHQNSFSSVENSFTSYQKAVSQHSLNMSVNEIQSSDLNPQVSFILQDLIIKHENSLKSLEQKIIHNLHEVFHKQHIDKNGQIRSQPLGLYLNENKVYQIICQTKSSIEHLFKKVYEINKQTNSQFSTINKKQYYEPLMSDSQKEDSSDEDQDQRNSYQMRENRNQHNVPLKRQQVPEVQKKQIVQEIQIKKKVQTIPQTPHIEEVQQNVKFSSIFTFAGQRSNIQEEFKPQPINQQDIQQTREINETSIRNEDEYESRIHYASQSQEEQEQENKNENEKQPTKVQPQWSGSTQPEIESQSESKKDQPSAAEQYSEYIRKMKQKGSRFQEQKETENVSTYEKPIFINRQYQQEERKMQEYQKKLDLQDQWDRNNSRKMFEKDPSLMGDSRLRSYFEQQQNQSERKKSTDIKYPHNLSKQQKFIGQSAIENDPQKKRIAEQWVNQRNKQKYKDFPQQRQEQNQLMEYVSYDYYPENERQKPYEGSKSIKNQFLQGPEHGMQNILPEQISQFPDFDIEQQRKIQQSIRIKNSMNLSREENPALKKFEKVINDVIVPGFNAFKKRRQTSNNQSLVRKAKKQQEDLQKTILQLAIDDSLQQYESNQNKSLNFNKISQIKQTDPKNDRFFQQPRITSNRQFENNLEQDFTRFQEFFKEMSTIKAPFSYQENSGFNFLEELEQDIRRPFTRRRLNDEMQIKDIKIRQEEMDISKEEFSIVVRVLKPVLLTFKCMDRKQNSPMAKFIVGDQTGIAVLYMRYYCDVKPGICLKLNRCRVCKYRSSFEITNLSRITTVNVLPGNFISQIKYSNYLSLVRGSSINDLSYEVRPDFNNLLRDCVRDMLRNGNQREQMIRKPLILTVCDANIQMKRYLLGDYTGRIVAQMNSCTKLMAKHETVLIKNIRICIRGDQILLVGQRSTVILKADFDWKFKHDLQYIPNEQFKVRMEWRMM